MLPRELAAPSLPPARCSEFLCNEPERSFGSLAQSQAAKSALRTQASSPPAAAHRSVKFTWLSMSAERNLLFLLLGGAPASCLGAERCPIHKPCLAHINSVQFDGFKLFFKFDLFY